MVSRPFKQNQVLAFTTNLIVKTYTQGEYIACWIDQQYSAYEGELINDKRAIRRQTCCYNEQKERCDHFKRSPCCYSCSYFQVINRSNHCYRIHISQTPQFKRVLFSKSTKHLLLLPRFEANLFFISLYLNEYFQLDASTDS